MYISFDIDCLDQEYAGATGTPRRFHAARVHRACGKRSVLLVADTAGEGLHDRFTPGDGGECGTDV